MSTKKKHFDYVSVIKENLNKLELNKSYKFTELCKTLGLEVPKGKNPKLALLKSLDSLVVRTEEKKKHIITAIREQQTEIVDNRGKSKGSRGNNKSIYGEDLMNTMIYACIVMADRHNLYIDNNKDEFILTTSRHHLMCEIGVRNRHNNHIANVQPNNFCNALNVSKSTFEFVRNKANANGYNAVKSALNKLIEIGLAVKTDTMKVVKYELNEDGTYNKDNKLVDRFATEEEYVKILHIKRKVATEMGYKNESEIHSSYNTKVKAEFYAKVNALTEEKLGLSEHYPMIKLHMSRNNIDQYLQKFDDITLDMLIHKGNEKFLNRQYTTLKSNRTKYINGSKSSKDKLAYVQATEDFIDESYDITRHLIDIFAPKIPMLEEDLKLDHNTGEFAGEANELEHFEGFVDSFSRNPVLIDILGAKYL